MPTTYARKFGLVAASVAGLAAASAATPAQAENLSSKDDGCPKGAVPESKLLDARKSGNESSAIGTLRAVNNAQGLHDSQSGDRKKLSGKRTVRKKTAKKAAKKTARKRPGRVKRAIPKVRKKAAKRAPGRGTARRDPC